MRFLYALVEVVWRSARAPIRALLGEQRVGRFLDVFGLRALKTKHFVLETKVVDGLRILYCPHDQCIIREIYHEHSYGSGDAFLPGQVVVDIGGHIGVFAIFASSGGTGSSHVCEPAPITPVALKIYPETVDLGQRPRDGYRR